MERSNTWSAGSPSYSQQSPSLQHSSSYRVPARQTTPLPADIPPAPSGGGTYGGTTTTSYYSRNSTAGRGDYDRSYSSTAPATRGTTGEYGGSYSTGKSYEDRSSSSYGYSSATYGSNPTKPTAVAGPSPSPSSIAATQYSSYSPTTAAPASSGKQNNSRASSPGGPAAGRPRIAIGGVGDRSYSPSGSYNDKHVDGGSSVAQQHVAAPVPAPSSPRKTTSRGSFLASPVNSPPAEERKQPDSEPEWRRYSSEPPQPQPKLVNASVTPSHLMTRDAEQRSLHAAAVKQNDPPAAAGKSSHSLALERECPSASSPQRTSTSGGKEDDEEKKSPARPKWSEPSGTATPWTITSTRKTPTRTNTPPPASAGSRGKGPPPPPPSQQQQQNKQELKSTSPPRRKKSSSSSPGKRSPKHSHQDGDSPVRAGPRGRSPERSLPPPQSPGTKRPARGRPTTSKSSPSRGGSRSAGRKPHQRFVGISPSPTKPQKKGSASPPAPQQRNATRSESMEVVVVEEPLSNSASRLRQYGTSSPHRNDPKQRQRLQSLKREGEQLENAPPVTPKKIVCKVDCRNTSYVEPVRSPQPNNGRADHDTPWKGGGGKEAENATAHNGENTRAQSPPGGGGGGNTSQEEVVLKITNAQRRHQRYQVESSDYRTNLSRQQAKLKQEREDADTKSDQEKMALVVARKEARELASLEGRTEVAVKRREHLLQQEQEKLAAQRKKLHESPELIVKPQEAVPSQDPTEAQGDDFALLEEAFATPPPVASTSLVAKGMPKFEDLSMSSKKHRVQMEAARMQQQLEALDREDKAQRQADLRDTVDRQKQQHASRETARVRQEKVASTSAAYHTLEVTPPPISQQQQQQQVQRTPPPAPSAFQIAADNLFDSADEDRDGFATLPQVMATLRGDQSPLQPKPSARLVKEAFDEAQQSSNSWSNGTTTVGGGGSTGMRNEEVSRAAFQSLLEQVIEEQPKRAQKGHEEVENWKKEKKRSSASSYNNRGSSPTSPERRRIDLMDAIQRRQYDLQQQTLFPKTTSKQRKNREVARAAAEGPRHLTPTWSTEMKKHGEADAAADQQRRTTPSKRGRSQPKSPRGGVAAEKAADGSSGANKSSTSPGRGGKSIPLCHRNVLQNMKLFQDARRSKSDGGGHDAAVASRNHHHSQPQQQIQPAATTPIVVRTATADSPIPRLSKLEMLAQAQSPINNTTTNNYYSHASRLPSHTTASAHQHKQRSPTRGHASPSRQLEGESDLIFKGLKPFFQDRADVRKVLSALVRADTRMSGLCSAQNFSVTLSQQLPPGAPQIRLREVLILCPPNSEANRGSRNGPTIEELYSAHDEVVPYAEAMSALVERVNE